MSLSTLAIKQIKESWDQSLWEPDVVGAWGSDFSHPTTFCSFSQSSFGEDSSAAWPADAFPDAKNHSPVAPPPSTMTPWILPPEVSFPLCREPWLRKSAVQDTHLSHHILEAPSNYRPCSESINFQYFSYLVPRNLCCQGLVLKCKSAMLKQEHTLSPKPMLPWCCPAVPFMQGRRRSKLTASSSKHHL